MKLVPKGSNGSGQGGDLLPASIVSALVRWYSGEGDKNDEAVSVALVQNLRRARLWLACDCCQGGVTRPVISPALLTSAETYYLRRLSGPRRAEHATSCPFHRAQSLGSQAPRTAQAKPIVPPVGYFSVLQPDPQKLAQRPDDDNPDRVRSDSIPKLARLLWFLMERAGSNRINFEQPMPSASITEQFKQIKRAAATIEVAPGIMLDRSFFTHAAPYHSQAVFARLRAAAAHWPRAHAPQAFMLLYAYDIDGHTVHLASGAPVVLATRVQSPRTRLNPVSGPFLVLIVVGEHPDVDGYAAVRGYAQPVHSGRHFIAVETNSQRAVVDTLIGIGKRVAGAATHFTLTRPFFDVMTAKGPARPDFLIEAAEPDTGEIRSTSIIIEETAPVPQRDISQALLCFAPIIVTSAVAARSGRLSRQFAAHLGAGQSSC